MPGYGVVEADEGNGLLAWSWAELRLDSAHNYWLASVRPDENRPHVMPVWGVWLEDQIWLSSSPESRKARNLRANPAVTITTDSAVEPVVVEGRAALIDDPLRIAAFAEAMDDKYETDSGLEFYAANATFAITPTVVFALDTDDFTGTPTRWTFPIQL